MNDTYVCKYCGKTFPFEKGRCNPSDYGLHYSDSDIYGREFTCIACDKLVTMTNRYIKYAIRDGFTKASLQRVVEHVEWVRDNIEVFHETRKLVETNKTLKLLTSTAMEQTSIVEEGFHSPKAPFYSDMEITVEEAPTLAAAHFLIRRSWWQKCFGKFWLRRGMPMLFGRSYLQSLAVGII